VQFWRPPKFGVLRNFFILTAEPINYKGAIKKKSQGNTFFIELMIKGDKNISTSPVGIQTSEGHQLHKTPERQPQ
jgi:hypothetical protein